MAPAQKKNGTINARIPTELRERISRIVFRHGTSDSAILEQLLTAFCDSVEQIDAVRWPAAVLLADKLAIAAEDEGNSYSTGPLKVSPPPKPPDKSQRHRGDGPHRAIPKSA